MKQFSLFILFLVSFNCFIALGQYDFHRYKMQAKSPNTIQIFDQINNIKFDFEVKSPNINLFKLNFADAEYRGDRVYCPLIKNEKKYSCELYILSHTDSKKIYLGNTYFYFSVCPNNKYMMYYCINDTFMTLFDLIKLKPIKNVTVKLIEEDFSGFYNYWSSDSKIFYFFTQGIETVIGGPYGYDIEKDKLTSYSVPDVDMCKNWSFNPDKMLIIYEDFYSCPDIESVTREPLKPNKEQSIHLFLYDIKVKKRKPLETNIGFEFDPKWINSDTCEYYNSKMNKRVRIKI